MVLEYLKSWVEGEAGKIAHARNSLFAGNYEGVEISGEARLTSRNREATETHKIVETWKAAVELAKIFHPR